jgi:hypothetical protein
VLSGSVGPIHTAVVIGCCLLFLISTSGVGGELLASAIAVLVLTGSGLVWLVQLVARAVGRRSSPRRRSARWFLAMPCALLIAGALLATDVPFRIRWSMARDDFNEVIEGLPLDEPADIQVDLDVPGRVGTFPVRAAWRDGSAVIFCISSFGSSGVAYLPEGITDDLAFDRRIGGVRTFEHVDGRWFVWHTYY